MRLLTSDLASEFWVQGVDLPVELLSDDLFLLLWLSLGQKLHKVVAAAGSCRHGACSGCGSHASCHRGHLGSGGWGRLVASTLVEFHL